MKIYKRFFRKYNIKNKLKKITKYSKSLQNEIITKNKVVKKDFFKLVKPLRKINVYLLVLILNVFVLTTGTSASYIEKPIVKGDKENVISVVNNLNNYTTFIDEKSEYVYKDIVNDKEDESYIEKPLITDTRTREEMEREKREEELKKLALEKAYSYNRNTYFRESSSDRYVIDEPETQVDYNESDGNTYSYGYCTWYVANKRTDIPNRWGNAKSWLSSAQKSGWPTGYTPQVGSVIVTSESWAGHVGYVESFDGDTITISEMNYRGWGQVNTRSINVNDPIVRGFIY